MSVAKSSDLIRVRCPGCKVVIGGNIGARGPCPKCGTIVVILPQSGGGSPPPQPPPLPAPPLLPMEEEEESDSPRWWFYASIAMILISGGVVLACLWVSAYGFPQWRSSPPLTVADASQDVKSQWVAEEKKVQEPEEAVEESKKLQEEALQKEELKRQEERQRQEEEQRQEEQRRQEEQHRRQERELLDRALAVAEPTARDIQLMEGVLRISWLSQDERWRVESQHEHAVRMGLADKLEPIWGRDEKKMKEIGQEYAAKYPSCPIIMLSAAQAVGHHDPRLMIDLCERSLTLAAELEKPDGNPYLRITDKQKSDLWFLMAAGYQPLEDFSSSLVCIREAARLNPADYQEKLEQLERDLRNYEGKKLALSVLRLLALGAEKVMEANETGSFFSESSEGREERRESLATTSDSAQSAPPQSVVTLSGTVLFRDEKTGSYKPRGGVTVTVDFADFIGDLISPATHMETDARGRFSMRTARGSSYGVWIKELREGSIWEGKVDRDTTLEIQVNRNIINVRQR